MLRDANGDGKLDGALTAVAAEASPQ